MSFFVWHCYIAHWLFVPFLETSRASGNIKSMIFLIIITMLTDNSSLFSSSLKFLHFDLLSGDGGQQLEQYLCVTFFGFWFGDET